ncbi:DUF4194 domain-containing protein [Dialister sp.]|jgi:hypothetical protein|uniref:DUF4194 domain-containing protein n=1 Tax=Dialister sp. TaxID=1955814 RepID=UPI002E80D310|nr:DUF4194 domain-containing protein [Dialister sp.]MEE3452377.1 DUF4194 domain-containing protein [Dialister sp.]
MDKTETLFSTTLISLLSGIVMKNGNAEIWNTIMSKQYLIDEYMAKIGLSLVIDEDGGYAFLKQNDGDELPHLVKRQPLSFRMSLFLVLLRNEINEYDSATGEGNLVVREEDMVRRMKPYFPEVTDEVKFTNSIDRCISKALEMKILMPVKDNEEEFEVQPILRRLVDAEWLSGFNREMERYMEENGISMKETEEEDKKDEPV